MPCDAPVTIANLAVQQHDCLHSLRCRGTTRFAVHSSDDRGTRQLGPSAFLDLNHTSKSMIPVSLMIPKFAPGRRGQATFRIGTLAPDAPREQLGSAG